MVTSGWLLVDLVPPATAVAALADGATFTRRGMEAFSEGRVEDSVKLFDQAVEAGYPKALLWQRGLSLYYVDRFNDGAAQFRNDVEMNPADTEESIWAMLCEARLLGFDAARRNMLAVGRDQRPVMRTVYNMFRGDDEADAKTTLERSASSGGSDEFYASLYLGLLAEAKNDTAESTRWIGRAVASGYAQSSGDYMADLARIHQKLRGWGVGTQASRPASINGL